MSALLATPPNVALYDALTINLAEVHEHIRALARQEKVSLVALDYAQQLAADGPEKARYLQVGDVGLRGIEMAREFDCAVVVTSQLNSFKAGKDTDYSFRESSNLEQKANNALLFIVTRDDSGHVTAAEFRARKIRDGAMFRLPVTFRPETFEVLDESRVVQDFTDVREWTR